ncbi:MAG: biopolymer transporter ExbD [candidate division WOR-3 bacterium]|nr:MAG: biopolymer transporter ExbD [candidate division WOR-3 bacterium]
MKKIAKKRESTPDIPMASTSDIAFLLIIFFMVSTVFRKEQGLQITIPEAEATERILKRRNVSNIWMDQEGKTTVSDNLVSPAVLTNVMAERVIENPDLVVMLQADREVGYGFVTDVLEALKEARALRITFATDFPTGLGG